MKINFGLVATLVMGFTLAVPALFAQEELPPLPTGQQLLRNAGFDDEAGGLALWSPRSGGLGTISVIKAKEEGEVNSLRIKVNQTSPRPWTMELLQKVETVVEKGSTVYVSFEYKITAGYSFNFYWQQEVSPWPKLLSLHVSSPVDSWHEVRMAVPVHQTFQPAQTAFSFHLAEQTGVLELRRLSAVMVPADVNPETLVTNATPVLGGDFYDKDWRGIQEARLAKVRQLPVTVSVQKGGKGLPGVSVSLRQTARPFRFGVEASMALLAPEVLAKPALAELARQIKEQQAELPKYREWIFQKSGLYQFITFYDGLIWRDSSVWGKDVDSALVAAARAAGLAVRGHALYVPAYHYAPVNCRNMDREALTNALVGHIRKLAEKHKDGVAEWSVLHGGIDYYEIYDYIGVDSMSRAFQIARKAAPEAKLMVSDIQSLTALSDVPLSDTIELVDWLNQGGTKVDGIVMGATLKRLDVGPQSMEKRLDQISGRLSLPIHIAGLSLNTDDEQRQADMLRDYLLLFFSHPAVASVSIAEQWAPALLNSNMAYVNADFTPRAAGAMLVKLLTEEWLTKADLVTGEDGTTALDAFVGSYELIAKVDGKDIKATIDIPALADRPAKATKVGPVTLNKTDSGIAVVINAD
ncbi:MAG TPA: endo-1,4-beta-xylanase [Lentisphaeria bacterium]|nr:endo-1,4-beta-xylanase [Lentisphaeria bacterium]